MAHVIDSYEAALAAPRPLSPMTAWLPDGDGEPTSGELFKRLEARFGPLHFEATPPPDDAPWAFATTLEGRPVTLWLQRPPRVDLDYVRQDLVVLTDDEQRALEQSRWAVGVGLRFDDAPLEVLHLQLRALAALAPNALLAFDHLAFRLHSFEWVRDAARSAVTPAPGELSVLHAATAPDGTQWLHTHGLSRLGRLELEMFDVPPGDAPLLAELLGTTAAFLLERPLPPPGGVFEVGHDFRLTWLPWEDAVTTHPKLGGERDRDALHRAPSAVLFAPGHKVLGLFGHAVEPITRFVPALEGAPTFHLLPTQTRRLALLARERLPAFRQLFALLGANRHFAFLVKLAFPTLDPVFGREEHLWFEVHALGDDTVEATCTNTPRAVPALSEGQRATHHLDRLCDWAVACPLGRFDAERIEVLEHILTVAPDELRRDLELSP